MVMGQDKAVTDPDRPATGGVFVFVPMVDSAEALHQLMARAAFYFEYLMPEKIVIGVTDATLEAEAFKLPPELTEQAAMAVTRLADVLDVRRISRRGLAEIALEADHLMRWDANTAVSGPWKAALRRIPAHAWGVDRFNDRMEGSIYIQAAHEASDGVAEAIAESRSRFHTLAAKLGQRDRAYLLATGPSISAYREHDFSDGLVIACNTVILDDDLMAATSPDIVVFADPIFHFGCSQYAAEFRFALQRAADRYAFDIVIPIKYYEHFLSLMPSLASRTIGVPVGADVINLDLREDFQVFTTDNVATLLMIPLGCTIADNLFFLGFDGRSPDETYFWAHGTNTQLSDSLMENIKDAHPSFFSVDYEDYYARHTTTMERMFWQGEVTAHTFGSLETSYIPALTRRSAPRAVAKLIEEINTEAAFTLLSINPDLENRFGHYFHFDERLRQAAETLGGRVVTIANRAWTGSEEGIVPWFTDHSWNLLREEPGTSRARFRVEMEAALRTVADADSPHPVGAFLYTGSHVHLAEILAANLQLDSDPLPIAMNLFNSHKEVQDLANGASSTVPITAAMLGVTRALAASLNVSVFGDSEKFIELMDTQCGLQLPLWPMFSTTDLPPLDSDRKPNKPLRVYAPGNLQFEKGYDLVVDFSEMLAKSDLARKIQLVARAVFHDGTGPAMKRLADRLRLHATVLEGELSDDEYIRQMVEADIILIPYRKRPFQTRTSAVISDAVSLGKPVVATRDTWAGDIVERFALGVTFEDGNGADMVAALREVVARHSHFRDRALAAAPVWRSESSPERLLTVIHDATVNLDSSALSPEGRDRLGADLTYARRLAGMLEASGNTDVVWRRSPGQDKRLREKAKRLEAQLQATRGSAAYRWAERIVGVLQRIPFLYRILRKLARSTT